MKRLKQLNINEDINQDDLVVRNLAYGISAGNNDLQNYEKWSKANVKALKKKLNVKN